MCSNNLGCVPSPWDVLLAPGTQVAHQADFTGCLKLPSTCLLARDIHGEVAPMRRAQCAAPNAPCPCPALPIPCPAYDARESGAMPCAVPQLPYPGQGACIRPLTWAVWEATMAPHPYVDARMALVQVPSAPCPGCHSPGAGPIVPWLG